MADFTKMVFTNQTIYDIVTCNPFTLRGKKCLERLELSKSISKDSFFGKPSCSRDFEIPGDTPIRIDVEPEGVKPIEDVLFVDTKYRLPHDIAITEFHADFHDFSADFGVLKNHTAIHDSLLAFETKFFDQASDELYILGASGSGKSVYVHYLLWKLRQQREVNHKEIFLNLEEAETEITYSRITFESPNTSAPWLFCTKLLDKVCSTIVTTAGKADLAQKVLDNYNTDFRATLMHNEMD
jgi:hypothetical protein